MTLYSPSESAVSEPIASAPPVSSPSISASEAVFNQLLEAIANQLKPEQHFKLTLSGESSQFTRFNGGKVRQSGQVQDAQLKLTLMNAQQTTQAKLPFVGDFETDWSTAQQILSSLQADLPQLPEDPYIVLPQSTEQSDQQSTQTGHSREVRSGQLIPASAIAKTLLAPIADSDFSGLYAGGTTYRAYGDSAEKRHWFESPSFTLDYSLFTPDNRAVKGTLAGQTWNAAAYQKNVEATQQQLNLLSKPLKSIPRGAYRTYLAPAAVADLMDTLMYGGLGEASLRQGSSAFEKLENGEATLSKKFSLGEDFQRIGVPRFNSEGIVAPSQLDIIKAGQWMTSLVSARSAKEYGKPSNAANQSESLRAPVVAAGSLSESQILAELGTGLYLSNLHYLNWSDLSAGRITGMTRYACFWVEDGEIVAPIENLRFDDSFYRFLSEDALLGLTEKQSFIPAVDTYERRSLGGMWTPGMLIDQFRYTL